MVTDGHRWLGRVALALLLMLPAACQKNESASTSAIDTSATDAAPSPAAIEAGKAMMFCGIIEAEATIADCQHYTALKAGLENGSAAFNAPAMMERGDTVRIRLAIDRAANSETPAKAVDALPGDTVAFQTKVGRNMAAELSGEGFAIKPLSPRSQDLFLSANALWEWDVTAKAGGERVLSLKTYVEAPAEDGTLKQRWVQVEDRAINVEVPVGQQISDGMDSAIGWLGKTENLLKALTAVVVAGIGLWLAFRKRG